MRRILSPRARANRHSRCRPSRVSEPLSQNGRTAIAQSAPARTRRAECSHRAREHALLRFFEKRDYLLTRYAREILEEFVNGISALGILNQVLDGQPRAVEA